jgi:hypothetical protein
MIPEAAISPQGVPGGFGPSPGTPKADDGRTAGTGGVHRQLSETLR